MKFKPEIKKKCSFFWQLRKRVSISAVRNVLSVLQFHEVYEQTRFKDKALVELNIPSDLQVKAYYLCGLSKGFKYDDNTHIAFVPCEGQSVLIENDKLNLIISDARQIFFQDYKPNPVGEYTQEQRTCRNWIFANYLLDGMPL